MSALEGRGSEHASPHYDRDYFDWQASIGEFGGWANLPKFQEFVTPRSDVLDFGCGGGYLLRALRCRLKLGVEVNPHAAEVARASGIDVYARAHEVPENAVDVVISNHALEHTLCPLDELRALARALRPDGRIVFVVPSESVGLRYREGDINHHLYTWSPMSLGNLFTEAGFAVEECLPYRHKWPPCARSIARLGGRGLFDIACRIYARLDRTVGQVRLIAAKPSSGAGVGS